MNERSFCLLFFLSFSASGNYQPNKTVELLTKNQAIESVAKVVNSCGTADVLCTVPFEYVQLVDEIKHELGITAKLGLIDASSAFDTFKKTLGYTPEIVSMLGILEFNVNRLNGYSLAAKKFVIRRELFKISHNEFALTLTTIFSFGTLSALASYYTLRNKFNFVAQHPIITGILSYIIIGRVIGRPILMPLIQRIGNEADRYAASKVDKLSDLDEIIQHRQQWSAEEQKIRSKLGFLSATQLRTVADELKK